MRAAQLVALGLLASCSGGGTPEGDNVEEVDAAVPADAVADAPLDAMACPPPPVVPPPAQPPGSPPRFLQFAEWRCTDPIGCAPLPPGDFMRAHAVEIIGEGAVTWYTEYPREGPIATMNGTATGNCWRLAADTDAAHCLTYVDICRCDVFYCPAQIQRYDVASRRWQRWEVRPHWPN